MNWKQRHLQEAERRDKLTLIPDVVQYGLPIVQDPNRAIHVTLSQTGPADHCVDDITKEINAEICEFPVYNILGLSLVGVLIY